MGIACPLFIVGVPRSGTTLLANRLNRHPDIHISTTGYSKNFYEFRRFALLSYGLKGDVRRFTTSDWAVHFAYEQPALKRLIDDLADEHHQGIRHLLARVVEKGAKNEGAKLWGVKSPRSLIEMPALFYMFPEAKFINIIRDGRAVAVSLRDRQEEHLEYAIHHWKRMIIIGRLDGAIAGPDRYFEVKFEDLLSDPDTTLRRILRFLDIEFNDVVTFEESTEGVVAPANNLGHVGKYVLPYFDTTKASAWKDKLTADEIKTVERIGGDVLQELGYDLLQYSPDGPFEALSPWRVVSKRQGKFFRRLVNPPKTRKSGEDVIEVLPSSLRSRIVHFVRVSANNYFSSRVVQQLRKNREMVD